MVKVIAWSVCGISGIAGVWLAVGGNTAGTVACAFVAVLTGFIGLIAKGFEPKKR